MKKDLKKELLEMKFLFGYKAGKVISEQNIPEMDMEVEMEDDILMADPDVMEPEVKPDTDRDVEERPSRPGRPDRDPSRLPYTDPDTHPQGESDDEIGYELEIDDEPTDEFEYELEIDDEPRRKPIMSGLRGTKKDEVNEPYVDNVDSEYENSDLADLVKKYLSKRG